MLVKYDCDEISVEYDEIDDVPLRIPKNELHNSLERAVFMPFVSLPWIQLLNVLTVLHERIGKNCWLNSFPNILNTSLTFICYADSSMIDNMRKACSYKTEKDIAPDAQLLQACFNSSSSAQTVYNLEVQYNSFMKTIIPPLTSKK